MYEQPIVGIDEYVKRRFSIYVDCHDMIKKTDEELGQFGFQFQRMDVFHPNSKWKVQDNKEGHWLDGDWNGAYMEIVGLSIEYGYMKDGIPYGKWRAIQWNGDYQEIEAEDYLGEKAHRKQRCQSVVYEGESYEGAAHGEGTLTFTEFDVSWVGNFKNEKPTGSGTLINNKNGKSINFSLQNINWRQQSYGCLKVEDYVRRVQIR